MDNWNNEPSKLINNENSVCNKSSDIEELATTTEIGVEDYRPKDTSDLEEQTVEVQEAKTIHQETSFIEKLKAKKGLLGILGGTLAILIKFKFIVLLLLSKIKYIFIVLKLSKFLGTAISMVVAIYVYSLLYGWSYGIGFVLLILTHELGHMMMAKLSNVKVSSPIFIPFVGAFIGLKEEPKDAVTEAKIAMGGPVFGTLVSLACLLMFFATGQGVYLALTYTGFMLNLFNLIPIHPIDGGRIVTAISPKIWYLGIPIMGFMMFKFMNPFILLFFIIGIMKAYENYKNGEQKYYEIPYSTKLIFGALYIGLILILGIGMYEIHNIYLIS